MTQYLDVTETVGLRFNSGIQRVVREMTSRLRARADDDAAVPVIAIGNRFHRLTTLGLAVLAGDASSSTPPVAHAVGGDGRLKTLLRRVRPLFAMAQRTRFQRRLRTMRDWYETAPVVLGRGDRIALIDTVWSGGSALNAASVAKRHGARIVLLVYDLIPLHHPELVSREVAYMFPRAISRAMAMADGIVTISRQGIGEVLEQMPRLDPARVTHAYLGHDFAAGAGSAAPTEASFPDGLWREGGRMYLAVGTIEPRKGHDSVLDGFERLWAAGGDQTLLIIGKRGWRAEGFLARCDSHPERGRRLFLIHDASDATLAEAIARCDALVMASWFEGFGLPLVEALSAGRPVLASDIAVFREIAGDAALFFRVRDPAAIAETVRRFEADPEAAAARARAFRWINWDEAADQLAVAIDRVLADPPVRSPAS